MFRVPNQIERTSPRASKDYKAILEAIVNEVPTIDGTNKCDTENNTPRRTPNSQINLANTLPKNVNIQL